MNERELEKQIWETIWSPTIIKTPQRKAIVLKVKKLIIEDRQNREETQETRS